MNVFLRGHRSRPCSLFRFLPGRERAGSLPEISGLPGQNQGWEDHAGDGKSSLLLLPAEVSSSHSHTNHSMSC